MGILDLFKTKDKGLSLGVSGEGKAFKAEVVESTKTLEDHKISLEKTIISLSKEKNVDIGNTKANVIFAIDVSGSMSDNVRSGDLQKLINKIFALALSLDDDGELKVYEFNNQSKRKKNVNINNYQSYVEDNLHASGGTSYSPVLNLIKEHEDLTQNTLIIFVTDGENEDKLPFEDVVRNMSKDNCFIQFVGIGSYGFSYLKKLDDLKGREVDNTGFEKFTEIYSLPDEKLYMGLLSQYADWLKTKNI